MKKQQSVIDKLLKDLSDERENRENLIQIEREKCQKTDEELKDEIKTLSEQNSIQQEKNNKHVIDID